MTESPSIDELMHTLLDGEADPAHRARFDAALASDPELRERYAALQSLFGELSRVSAVTAPAGLGDAALSRFDAIRGNSAMAHQHSAQSRVLGSTRAWNDARDSGQIGGFNQLIQSLMGFFMSDQASFMGSVRGKLTIAAGAVAAVAVVAFFGVGGNSSTSDKDTIGTIAPAERYIASQPTADDVKRNDDAVGVRKSDDAAGGLGGSDTEKSVDRRPDAGADKVSHDADRRAEKQADMRADVRADKQADKQADKLADKLADKRADKRADARADKQADKLADKLADKQADKRASKIADKVAGE